MVNKSGYIDTDENEEENIEEPKLSNSVSISERRKEKCLMNRKLLLVNV